MEIKMALTNELEGIELKMVSFGSAVRIEI